MLLLAVMQENYVVAMINSFGGRFLFDRSGIGLRDSRNSKEAGGQSSDQFGHFDSFWLKKRQQMHHESHKLIKNVDASGKRKRASMGVALRGAQARHTRNFPGCFLMQQMSLVLGEEMIEIGFHFLRSFRLCQADEVTKRFPVNMLYLN